MKKLTLILILGLVLSHTYAQKLKESEVPAAVKAAFTKAYPGIKTIKWEKESGDFEAEFDKDKKEMSVLLDAMGMIKEEETEISKTNLPKAVQNALTKDYAGYKVEEAAKIMTGQVITYEAEVEKGEESLELLFDVSGKVIKKQVKEKEKEQKKD